MQLYGSHFNLFPEKRATPLPGGYVGKILRVDLTTDALTNQNLPEEPVLRKALQASHRAMILQNLFGTQRGWVVDID